MKKLIVLIFSTLVFGLNACKKEPLQSKVKSNENVYKVSNSSISSDGATGNSGTVIPGEFIVK